MRRTTFFVLQVGDRWTVSCSLRGAHESSHPDRASARAAADAAALAMWQQQRVATQVMVSEDDGGWHTAAEYGDLLGS